MLALFCALGRFCSIFLRLAVFVGARERFFRVLGRSKLDFGRLWARFWLDGKGFGRDLGLILEV